MSTRSQLPGAGGRSAVGRSRGSGGCAHAALLLGALLLALGPVAAGAAGAPEASPPARDAAGDDHVTMDRTRIIGNRELPKVLYIVPWKKPQPGELPGRPLKSVLDEALEPIDRDVFRRQVQYETQYAAQRTPAAATTVPNGR